MRLSGLRATFADQSWAECFGWLLSQPEVVSVVEKRMEESC